MIFEFSWSDYEDYIPYILEGEERSREEFEADCNKSLKESFDDYMSNIDYRWAGLPIWIEYAVVKMEDYGYKRVKPLSFGYCGLCLPKTDRYCDGNNDLHMKEYQEDFPKFLDEIKRMIEHNDVVDERLHKKVYEKLDKEIKDREMIRTQGENKIVIAKDKKAKVALMGTCAESTWREELIPQLEIDYFNPVVDDWTPECQEEEIRQRESCDYVLYVISSEMQGAYSIAEVVDDSNKRPEKTVFCYLEDGFEAHQIKSLKQVAKMVAENGAKVCVSLEDVARYLNAN